MSSSASPTVVLVHGAFADSSGWNATVERLQDAGIATKAVPNPLRGITEDAAYVASALQQTQGPVLVVGHSYGGAVLTNAATRVDNVIGLVYVAAFAPDEGETLMQIEGRLQGQRPHIGAGRVHLSVSTGHPDRAHDRPSAVPRCVRRRYSTQGGCGHGRHATPGLRARLLRKERPASLEIPAILGGGGRPATKRRAVTWFGPWPSGPERPSPRSTGPTSSWCPNRRQSPT